MSKINLTYLNKKVKCGLAMSLIAISLASCTNTNNEKGKTIEIVTENNDAIELYPIFNAYSKNSIFSDKELKKIEKSIGTDRIILEVIDESDYIKGLELVVKDLKGNIIADFITEGKDYILTGIEEGKTYIIEEKNILENYDLEEKGYKFTAPYKNKKYPEQEYYLTNYLTINKESKEYKLRENNGEFLITVYGRGEDIKYDRMSEVTFEVKDLNDKVIETFTSTERSHNVTNLEDGKYKVKIISMPEGYELEMITGPKEFINVLENNECIVNIENGKCQNENFVGPVFYINNTLDKTKKESNNPTKIYKKNNN